MRHTNKAFTLIELLIVVAIIGILAAIAIPNFQNARIRAKVSRAYADMKSLENPIILYNLDHNTFPVSQFFSQYNITTRYPISLTTPVSYIDSIPIDYFINYAMEQEQYPDVFIPTAFGNPSECIYSYARFGPAVLPSQGQDVNKIVMVEYGGVYGGVHDVLLFTLYPKDKMHWRLESAGPDQIRWRNKNRLTIPFSEPLYDASNGIVSNGNLYLSDEGMGAVLMKYMQHLQ